MRCGGWQCKSCRPASADAREALELIVTNKDEPRWIRVFPAWPQDKPASFYNLRSQGGFLVSASQFGSGIREIKIFSTVGGTCRLASPWPGISVSMDEGGQAKPLTMDAERIVELETRPNQYLIFRPAE